MKKYRDKSWKVFIKFSFSTDIYFWKICNFYIWQSKLKIKNKKAIWFWMSDFLFKKSHEISHFWIYIKSNVFLNFRMDIPQDAVHWWTMRDLRPWLSNRPRHLSWKRLVKRQTVSESLLNVHCCIVNSVFCN